MSLSQPLGLHRHLTQPSRGLDIVPLFNVLLIALMLTLLGSRFIFAPGQSVDLPQAGTGIPATMESGAAMSVLTLLKDNSLIYAGRLLSVENFEREAQTGLGKAGADAFGAGGVFAPASSVSAVPAETSRDIATIATAPSSTAPSTATITAPTAAAPSVTSTTVSSAIDGTSSAHAPEADAGQGAPPPRVLLIKADASVSYGTILRVMNAARLAGYERVQLAEQAGRSASLQSRRSPAQGASAHRPGSPSASFSGTSVPAQSTPVPARGAPVSAQGAPGLR